MLALFFTLIALSVMAIIMFVKFFELKESVDTINRRVEMLEKFTSDGYLEWFKENKVKRCDEASVFENSPQNIAQMQEQVRKRIAEYEKASKKTSLKTSKMRSAKFMKQKRSKNLILLSKRNIKLRNMKSKAIKMGEAANLTGFCLATSL